MLLSLFKKKNQMHSFQISIKLLLYDWFIAIDDGNLAQHAFIKSIQLEAKVCMILMFCFVFVFVYLHTILSLKVRYTCTCKIWYALCDSIWSHLHWWMIVCCFLISISLGARKNGMNACIVLPGTHRSARRMHLKSWHLQRIANVSFVCFICQNSYQVRICLQM